MTTNQVQIAKATVAIVEIEKIEAIVEIEKAMAKRKQEIKALKQAIDDNAKRAFKEEK